MTSLARKFVMALSGLFLITFITIHLLINSFSLGLWWDGEQLFNQGSHFMATNPLIQIMQYILAAGFIIHIALGIILTLKNKAARPTKYAVNKPSANSTMSSRSMIVTGLLVMAFIFLHMKDFFIKLKFGDPLPHVNYTHEGVVESLQNDFSLLDLFANPLYVAIYVLAFIALGIHLNHGFQSAFQSLGAADKKITPTIKMAGKAFSIFIAVGFSAIAIFHYINSLG